MQKKVFVNLFEFMKRQFFTDRITFLYFSCLCQAPAKVAANSILKVFYVTRLGVNRTFEAVQLTIYEEFGQASPSHALAKKTALE